MNDPFDTAARRQAVLAAWKSSPTRFREDANAEEDLVLGGYADRLLVELAQNASDAAARAGVPGALRLTLADRVLTAANTGAPLDAEGVDGLTSLRASGKRDEQSSTGRFGIGFAATLAVSDEPELRSTTGGIRFSLQDTDKAVRELGGAAAAELDRRDGRAAVLRLAWPADEPPADGYATEVRLPLRDDAALAAVRKALDEVDPSLLLALPGLSKVDVSGRVIGRTDLDEQTVALADGESVRQWRYVSASGDLPEELLTDRPIEERIRQAWRVTAAVPLSADGQPAALKTPQVLYAPTPTDERISLPVRLIGTFPTSPDRRRVPDSAVTRFLAEQAAEAVADLISGCSGDPAVLRLLPGPELPLSTVDSLVRAAVDAQLRTAVWLPDTHSEWLPPSRAIAVDDALVEMAADVLDGVLPAGWWTSATAPALRALGVRRLGLAEVVEAFASADGEPSWWHDFYDAIDTAMRHDPSVELGEVAAIRVPLADGRTVTGAREVLLPVDDLPAEAVGALGLRVVHPDAAHPLLARLGARDASPASVLADPRVRVEVEQSYELDDPAPVAEAVLALVAATEIGPGELPWLADLALPDSEGDWRPAGELLLPGAPLAGLIGADVPFGTADRQLVEDYGADVLAAIGTLATFAVVDQPDLDLSDVDELALDGVSDWADDVADALDGEPVQLARFAAIRDLELIRPDAWPQALRLLAAPPARDALLAGCTAELMDGRIVPVVPYLRWWFAHRPVLAGRRPADLRLPDAAELVGLYDPVPEIRPVSGPPSLFDVDDSVVGSAAFDNELLAALGCRTGLVDVLDDAASATDLLHRLGQPDRSVHAAVLPLLYARLADALTGVDVPPPDRVRVAPEVVVPAEQAVVLDQPWRLADLPGRHPILGGADPEAVAELLDIPLASEL